MPSIGANPSVRRIKILGRKKPWPSTGPFYTREQIAGPWPAKMLAWKWSYEGLRLTGVPREIVQLPGAEEGVHVNGLSPFLIRPRDIALVGEVMERPCARTALGRSAGVVGGIHLNSHPTTRRLLSASGVRAPSVPTRPKY